MLFVVVRGRRKGGQWWGGKGWAEGGRKCPPPTPNGYSFTVAIVVATHRDGMYIL